MKYDFPVSTHGFPSDFLWHSPPNREAENWVSGLPSGASRRSGTLAPNPKKVSIKTGGSTIWGYLLWKKGIINIYIHIIVIIVIIILLLLSSTYYYYILSYYDDRYYYYYYKLSLSLLLYIYILTTLIIHQFFLGVRCLLDYTNKASWFYGWFW